MKHLTLLPCLSSIHLLPAQSPFAPFKDGIYFSHESLKQNAPEIWFDSLSVVDGELEVIVLVWPEHPHRIKDVFLRVNGKREKKVKTQDIWALCYDGTVYIRLGKELVRIIKFGSLCHFTMEEPVYLNFFEGLSNRMGSSLPRDKRQYTRRGRRFHQFVLDFETGTILPFDLEAMAYLLERDRPLFEAFQKELDQEEKLFIYLTAFNRRNPLLIR